MQDLARYPQTVLGTVCLPWQADGTLDDTIFSRTITNLVAAGLPDLYIFGTAGEGYAVTETVFRHVVRLFAKTMQDAGGAPPMVGVVSLSLATMIERIAFCEDQGIRSFQFSLPNWKATSDVEMRRVFAAICDRFPDSKFLHYNLMRSGRLVRPHDYAELAELHPNLVATKYGGGEPVMISGLLTLAPKLRHFFTEPGYFLGAPLGPCGLLASTASSHPKRAHEYLYAGATGNSQRLCELYRELCGVLNALLFAVGTNLIDGAYDKVIHKLSEPDFPLALLPPYEAAQEAAFVQYRATLEAEYPDWLPHNTGCSQAIQDCYKRDGVVRVNSFFSLPEVAAIRERLHHYTRTIAPSLPATDVVFEADGVAVRNLWRMEQHDPFFAEIAARPAVRRLVATLVHGNPELMAVETFNKPARIGSGVPPHQDNAYFCQSPPDVLTIWVALDAATDENGPIYYIRGSHAGGILPHQPSGIQGNSMGIAVGFDKSDPFIGTLAPGDALIHHCQTIHYSSPNKTDHPRCGLLMVFRGSHTQADQALRDLYTSPTKAV